MARFDNCMCHLKKKEIFQRLDEFVKVVDEPRYICGDCARLANRKRNLCQPRKLPR